MKTLGKIKLNQFSKNELERRKMSVLKGGCGCRDAVCNCVSLWNVRSVHTDTYNNLLMAY